MRSQVTSIVLLLFAGCSTRSPEGPDLRLARSMITFESVPPGSKAGYTAHWHLGSKAAWYNRERTAVLVTDSGGPWTRILGFPAQWGNVIATGWENDRDFFVHVSYAEDMGTMIYIDLARQQVLSVEHWGAY